MNKITRIAKEIITVLHSLYEKYKIPIDTTLKTLTIAFLSRYLPKSWWTSTPLNWSISSQTTLIGITTALILILAYHAKVSELRRQISILTSRRVVSLEEAAEILRGRYTYGFRMFERLLFPPMKSTTKENP
jgi:hypothetical protein